MFEKIRKSKAQDINSDDAITIDIDVSDESGADIISGEQYKEQAKGALDYLKEELKERASENEALKESIQAEKQRLADAREQARNRNVFRKIKVVDNAISKKEVERDAQALQEFRQAEQKKIAAARSERSKEIASKNKKPIAALLSGLLVAGCAAGGFANHSHNVAVAADYNQAVSYIMSEQYDEATEMLSEIELDDSDALYQYAYQQSIIDDYKGKPGEMLEDISDINGIENGEVLEQRTNACEELKLADEIQTDIDAIDVSSVDAISEKAIDTITTLKSRLKTRYAALLNTEKYDLASKVLYNVENETEAGKLIEDIDNIGEVSLESKSLIDDLNKRYTALSDEDKETILNYNVLTSAEKIYKDLKKKEDDRIAAEKKAEEERLAKEKEEAEKKAEEERIAAEKEQEQREAEEKQREEDASKANYTVYVTSGSHYHFDGCSRMGSKNKRSLTQGQAIAQGYTPCSYCVSGYDVPSYYYAH